jgi:N-acetylglutamate synthase-like GNAT family acetyltransferase
MTFVMKWCEVSASPQFLADFFVRHVTPEYVSHAEIQLGRAHLDGAWSEKLSLIIAREFAAILSPQDELPLHQTRAFAGYEDNELVCVGMIGFNFGDGGPYAVIEDLIVHSAKRDAKYGTRALEWIESSMKQIGVVMLFCETGTRNSAAQRFFNRRGFDEVSVVFVKGLASATASTRTDDWRSRVWELGREQE